MPVPTGRRHARQAAASGQLHGTVVPDTAGTTPAHGVPAPVTAGQDLTTPDAPHPVPAQGVPAAAIAPQTVPPHGISAPPAPAATSRPVLAAPVQALVGQPAAAAQAQPGPQPAQPLSATPIPQAAQQQPWPGSGDTSGAGVHVPQPTPAAGTPLPPERTAQPRTAQPLPAEAAAPVDPHATQGRAINVRTLGQGVPFVRQVVTPPQPEAQSRPQPPTHSPGQTNGSGRRRKLGTPPEPAGEHPETAARPHPQAASAPLPAQPSLAGQSRLVTATEGAGRSYAIGAPDANADEGPEPLDGPGGAIEIADHPQTQPMDDELPPEPLDNPRRLLVWPAPDVTTQQALSDRGYRPVVVNSREEVDAQIAAFPAALFVDPLTGPITRTALQSLRQAAVAAEVPVLVTAGLGQATREAAYGADPAVLLKALAPRDSEQHPPRVLLIEEHTEIALALTATLERRGMQVARAASDTDAVTLAAQMRPNLVVMDLMQVHRRQAGVVDWLRANNLLNRTPLVVYTAAVDQADLPRLVSGETVLFLAERSTSAEVQGRIVDLLARIGTN